MSKKLFIFEANKQDGIMSRNKKFYPQNLTQEEINQKFLETRLKLGKKYDFDGKKIVQATQKSQNNSLIYPDGTYSNLDKVNFTQEDYWYEDLPADILLFSKETPNVVVGQQMADCPVLIAEDRRLEKVAVAHCGASYINRELPKQTIEALKKEYNSQPKNIHVYIGSCAKKETYGYETYPNWATNHSVWENFIQKKEGKYHIDLVGAIKRQLEQINVEHIKVSAIDTISNPNYASNYGRLHDNPSKMGQNFVGCFYKEDDNK